MNPTRGSVGARLRPLAICLCLASATLTTTVVEAAEPNDPALIEARSRFQQALARQAADDWSGALQLLEQVAAVVPTPQVRFNIALCQEKLGQLSTALGNYRIAASAAKQAKLSDVEKQAMAKVADIDARLPKLVITRGSNAGAARIFIDANELGASSIGQELPVNPGPHQIEARLPGSTRPTVVLVTVAERERRKVEIMLEEAKGDTNDQKPPTPERPINEAPKGGGGPSTLTWVGLGVAGVGVGVGTVTGILMFSKKGSLDKGCTDKQCPPPTHDDLSTAYTFATISTVAFIVAGVGAATFVVGLLTKKAPAAATSGSASTRSLGWVVPGGLSGSF